MTLNLGNEMPILRESLPDVDEPYAWLGGKKLYFAANTLKGGHAVCLSILIRCKNTPIKFVSIVMKQNWGVMI